MDKNNIERMQMNAEGFKAAANYLDQAISKMEFFLESMVLHILQI